MPEIAAGEILRPAWRRLRYWVGLVIVVLMGAVLVGTLSDGPGRTLDPDSARRNGSKALARLITGYGATVTRTADLGVAAGRGASATVVVTAPDDYSDEQLHTLRRSARRLVLVQPGTGTLAALAARIEPDLGGARESAPACRDAGALAAGDVELPDDAITYRALAPGATSCYGGVVVLTPKLVVLGSAGLLRNDNLRDHGVAALAVNTVTADRRARAVVWLLPGADAGGSGPASFWDLFPDGAYRAFWWLIAVGALLTLWRSRRLGGVVREPLPVVVRSAEVVEGHGRLYARAHALDRAAAALRGATTGRLAARLARPRGTGPDEVAVGVAPIVGRAPADVLALLAGPAPADDAALLRLAIDLDHLEAAAGGAATEGT